MLKLTLKHLMYLAAFATLITFSSCDPDETPLGGGGGETEIEAYDDGFFVVNEGQFGTSSGTLTFVDYATGTIVDDVFQKENGTELGLNLQSLTFHNGNGYAVVTETNTVEIFEGDSLMSIGSITGLAKPRYFLPIDATTAYVSQWGADGLTGSVEIVDLTTNTITASIPTNSTGGSGKMVKVGDFVYVVNENGFGSGNSISRINTTTNGIINIGVGANPNSIVVDANNDLWVLSSGIKDFNDPNNNTAASLAHILNGSASVNQTLNFPDADLSATNLIMDNAQSTLYFLYDNSIISLIPGANEYTYVTSKSLYGLAIDVNNILYGCDAGDFASSGMVFQYTTDGTPVDSFTVGVAPNNVVFR